jgi:hypothetical protein
MVVDNILKRSILPTGVARSFYLLGNIDAIRTMHIKAEDP